MARTLDQILAELAPVYNPQIQSVQKRQAMIPGQIKAEEQGLQAKQTQAFDDILGGARRRGLGFSGIPLGEQARYTSTEYLPALARLRQSGREQAMSLEDAILGIQERRGSQAQGIYQAEQDRALAAKQNAALSNIFNQPPPKQATAKMQQRKDKGFNFQSPDGKPISAAQYSQLTGVPFRTLLQEMANAGDAGAKQALGFVGDDYGVNSGKLNSGGSGDVAKILNALLWGVNNASYNGMASLPGLKTVTGSSSGLSGSIPSGVRFQ